MRPRSISILCSILFFLQTLALVGGVKGLLILLGIFELEVIDEQTEVTRAFSEMTVSSSLYSVFINILTLVSIYGLWKMKRWGVFLFGIILALGLFVTYVISPPWVLGNNGLWWLPFILPVIYFSVVIPNWDKLN